MMLTLVKSFIVPVSFLVSVSWWCLLLACIALPVTVSFTSITYSTFLPAIKKGHSTTPTRGRHCHDLYNNLHRRRHEQFTCALLKMNKIANMQDALYSTTTTTSINKRADNEGHEAASLLEQIDAILHTKMEHGSVSLSQRKEETLAMIDASHANDIDFCASLGTEASLSISDSASGSGITQNPSSAPIIPAYEWVYVNDNDNVSGNNSKDHSDGTGRRPIAIRTSDPQQPILDQDSISIIRNAAQNMWEANKANADAADADADTDAKSSSSSRFTYQRKGNYEAHLVDLANNIDDNGRIRAIMMDALGKRIYPMVRDAFRPLVSELDDLDLRVYDSLVIRYNSTEAMMMGNPLDANHNHDDEHDHDDGTDDVARGFLGAGQPLHRDLGLISVNIMLNPAEEFQGGGTFLENQLRDHIGIGGEHGSLGDDGDGDDHKHDPLPVPLKPIGAGHAVAHLSNERHAGVATTSGVRDILVLFLTATQKSTIPHSNNDADLKRNDVESTRTHTAPCMERAARLKTYARPNCIHCETLDESILCRMMHHRLALQFAPQDGEAWHYLGMALREYAKTKTETKHEAPLVALETMQLSIACLERAFQLTPCDARLCNNLGLAYETLSAYIGIGIGIGIGSNESISEKEEDAHNAIDHYYKQSVRIHELCERVGCDISFDFATVALNYGLFVSNNDEFYDAVQILKKLRRIGKGVKYVENPEEDRIIEDGLRLLNFCEGMTK